MSYAIIDIVFAIIVLFCIVRVTIKGFVGEFFSKAAVVLGALGAALFFRLLTPYVEMVVGKNVFSGIVAFLLLFIAIYIIIKIIQIWVDKLFKGKTMTSLDRALGFFLGLIEGLLIVGVCLLIIRLQPFVKPEVLIDGSLFSRFFTPFLAAPEVMAREFLTAE
ncbi:MAG: CvpA family protein [Spirochaetaceae bacterium]|jgi:membrane protein required for colicin V production|nr:CvpA family protein [Spirochaetaceae bacterium]